MCGCRRTSFSVIDCSESATRESALVRFDLGEEHALEQEVADFAPQRGVIAAIDRIENLVGFLEHESAQRLDRLLAIPRASARPAQARHDVDER